MSVSNGIETSSAQFNAPERTTLRSGWEYVCVTMTRVNVPPDEPPRSAITDELDRIREKRTSLQKSKTSETDDAALKPLPATKRP